MSQPEFWLTAKFPGSAFYQTPFQRYVELHNMSLIYGGVNRPWNRYYARKVINVSFTETVGLQTLSYDTTDIYDYIFTSYIADQPDEGTVMLCRRINGKLYSFGSEGRNDGGYS